MAEQLGPFIGAGREFKRDVLSISQFINQGVSVTMEVFAAKPVGAQVLVLDVITGAVRIRVGDYRDRNFVDGDVSLAADTVTLTGETAFGVAAGSVVPDPYKLKTSGVLPTGLEVVDDIFFLRVLTVSPDVVAFYTNDADARADTNRVDISTNAGGGTHTIGGMPLQAGASIQDGYGFIEVPGAVNAGPGVYKFAAPDRVTFLGEGVGAEYNYYWI